MKSLEVSGFLGFLALSYVSIIHVNIVINNSVSVMMVIADNLIYEKVDLISL